MTLILSSPAFGDGQAIPKRYTCDGEDLSPAVTWSGAPAETKSFALTCDDPDAPRGTWHHWAIYDVPAGLGALSEGLPGELRLGQMRQAINDFGDPGYGGPCPPRGHGTHHYHFRLLALDTESLPLTGGAQCSDVAASAQSHVLAEAELIGTYARPG